MAAKKDKGKQRTASGRGGYLYLMQVLVLIAATGAVIWVSAQTSDGAAKSNAAETNDSDQPAESTADDAAEGEDDGELPVPVEVAEVATGDISSYITATANRMIYDQSFLHSVLHETIFPVGYQDALKALQLAIAAREAAANEGLTFLSAEDANP